MKESTTITTKGQVTIPKDIREELKLKPGDKVIFEKEGNRVILKPAKTLLDFRGYVKARRPIPMEEAREIAKRKRGQKVKGELGE
jgi:AbrB family looped-hinge helix DNA binding protein